MLSKLLYFVRNPRRAVTSVRTGPDPNVERYIRKAPHPQNAVELFKDLWWSQFPDEYGVGAGRMPLFWDPRMKWAIETLGVKDLSILELGPLEGGHTYMLERAGARSILGIEGDAHSFLRCLITKEIVRLERARFLLGDFEVYLRVPVERFDLTIASGVLYHVKNPIELLCNIARITDRVYIWTHYFDPERLRSNSVMAHRFPVPGEPAEWEGFRYTGHRYEYGDFLGTARFAGGTSEYSIWLTRDDLLGALRHYGLTEIEIGNDEPDHVNGPAITLVATRPGIPKAQ